MGDFAGGEHDQDAAVAEGFDAGAEAFAVLVGAGFFEWVHEDDAGMQGWSVGEKRVGDDAVIGADLFEEGDEDEAFQEAERVVGDDEAGSGFGMRSMSAGSTL